MSSLGLPDEILEKILLEVPAFDLVRCKGVCKGWQSLISSADFVAAHLRRAKSDPSSHHLLVRGNIDPVRRKKPVPVAIPLPSFICFSSYDLLIVGSVNGLICIAGQRDAPPSPDDIWIWNPLTGLSKKLPNSSRVFRDSIPRNVKIAFWCDDESEFDGGGVYKVAKIFTDFHGESTTLELWVSTSPDTWTVICSVELDFNLLPRRGIHKCDVLIEGLAAYWIVVLCGYDEYGESDYESDCYRSDDEGDDEIRDDAVVISLDLKTLALTKFIPLTKQQLNLKAGYLSKLEGAGYDESLLLFGGTLNGEFALVAYSCFSDYYDVWTHDIGAAIWIKNFTICFDEFTYDTCLGTVNDKILLLTQYEDAEVVSYDLLTGMLEVLETDSKLYDVTLESAFGFVESLVSINGFGVEPNDLFRKNMAISWPNSLYHHNLQEGGSAKEPGKRIYLQRKF